MWKRRKLALNGEKYTVLVSPIFSFRTHKFLGQILKVCIQADFSCVWCIKEELFFFFNNQEHFPHWWNY